MQNGLPPDENVYTSLLADQNDPDSFINRSFCFSDHKPILFSECLKVEKTAKRHVRPLLILKL